jgi:UDP-GlcNAc:undecaprenyl-phosphate/decaprenyl-phosphate GlcNAc-1-phosphate transferase
VIAVAAVAAAVGFAVALALVPIGIAHAPRALVRTNVSGRRVPAVLGGPLVTGGLTGVAALGGLAVLGVDDALPPRMAGAVVVLSCAMYLAGTYDDRRGAEAARGFGGHLTAARSGALTGGAVKAVVGALAGVAAGAVVADGLVVVEVAALCALTANLVNLLDRAPGRAGKAVLILWLPLVPLGHDAWLVSSAGVVGALIACLRADLSERAMLGDAGANPLGAVAGLGLAAALDEPGRLVAIALLLALNLASERWSFSQVIEGVRWLRSLDDLGRRK